MSDELNDLIARARDGASAIQELQDRYDVVGWQIKDPSYAQVRHILLHLMKITADVAVIVEHVEHELHNGTDPTDAARAFDNVLQERSDLGAELLFHASQFANLSHCNMVDEIVKIYARNAKRFAPDSEFNALG